jgi:hypothetical protein
MYFLAPMNLTVSALQNWLALAATVLLNKKAVRTQQRTELKVMPPRIRIVRGADVCAHPFPSGEELHPKRKVR